jgi:hypothetical protein
VSQAGEFLPEPAGRRAVEASGPPGDRRISILLIAAMIGSIVVAKKSGPQKSETQNLTQK